MRVYAAYAHARTHAIRAIETCTSRLVPIGAKVAVVPARALAVRWSISRGLSARVERSRDAYRARHGRLSRIVVFCIRIARPLRARAFACMHMRQCGNDDRWAQAGV